jgi:hypothetical protein
MRRRINRTLLTATAASASVITLSFMATGAVGAATTTTGLASGASSVTPIPSLAVDCGLLIGTPLVVTPSGCAVAGYQASGRLFRYAQASIVVPLHAAAITAASGSSPQVESDGAIYVALDNSSDTANDFARVGIVACPAVVWTTGVAIPGVWPCPGTSATTTGTHATNDVALGWYAFSTTVQPDGVTPVWHDYALNASQDGLGVFASVYLSPTGNSVHTVIKTPATLVASTVGGGPTKGHTYNDTFAVNGPTYTNAQAAADWTTVESSTLTVPFQPASGVTAGYPGTVAYTQFKDGRVTTWAGTRGTFNGKWTVTPMEATVDGTTGTTVVTSPGYLWSSTTGYQKDAFGVWLRHV